MAACCGQQASKTFKVGDDACFTCLGGSQEHILQMGHFYPCCSPLVEGPTKHDAWRPMTTPTECIVGWVGPVCAIDAADWTEDKFVHVYPEGVAIKQAINWPVNEAGEQIFTVADIEGIVHAHHCCIHFDKEYDCLQAPAWVKAQNTPDAAA